MQASLCKIKPLRLRHRIGNLNRFKTRNVNILRNPFLLSNPLRGVKEPRQIRCLRIISDVAMPHSLINFAAVTHSRDPFPCVFRIKSHQIAEFQSNRIWRSINLLSEFDHIRIAMRVLPRRHLNVKHQGQGYLILCPITPDGLFYRE